LAGSDVHLYNMNSKETVDYGGLKIEIIDENIKRSAFTPLIRNGGGALSPLHFLEQRVFSGISMKKSPKA
jgi:hypothetical protein